MIGRPSLLALTAAVAAASAIANGVSAASPTETGAEPSQTRLGAAIDQDLSARDRAANQRNRALDLREQATRAAEARLKANIDAGQQAEAAAVAQPQGRAGSRAEEQTDQFDDLARIYQAMKPAQAAVVFERLDLYVQMKVAQKMRERSTAMIMGAMTPTAAATLSMALARRGAGSVPPPRQVAARP